MSSRLVSAALSKRTVIRNTALAAAQQSNSPRLGRVNGNTSYYASLENSTPGPFIQVTSSPTLALLRSLSQQTMVSTPASSSLPQPVNLCAQEFEESGELEQPTGGVVSGEQHSKVMLAWEPVENELWLERFGGPGRTIEGVSGDPRMVLRDAALDGKGYLKILI